MELVVDGRGSAYLNGGGFNLMAGEESAPGIVAMVSPGGSARQVAGGLSLPNGMPVTPGAQTLIVAQSYAKRLTAFEVAAGGGLSNRRVWAELGDSVPAAFAPTPATPSGTPASPASAAVRAREDGEVLDTVELDCGRFARALAGPGKARCS